MRQPEQETRARQPEQGIIVGKSRVPCLPSSSASSRVPCLPSSSASSRVPCLPSSSASSPCLPPSFASSPCLPSSSGFSTLFMLVTSLGRGGERGVRRPHVPHGHAAVKAAAGEQVRVGRAHGNARHQAAVRRNDQPGGCSVPCRPRPSARPPPPAPDECPTSRSSAPPRAHPPHLALIRPTPRSSAPPRAHPPHPSCSSAPPLVLIRPTSRSSAPPLALICSTRRHVPWLRCSYCA